MFPALGKRPIDQINALKLLETIRKIDARGTYTCVEYLPELERKAAAASAWRGSLNVLQPYQAA